MAFFKSADEKAAEQATKEQNLLDKYGVSNLSDPADLASVRKIAQELVGSGLMEAGMKIAMANDHAGTAMKNEITGAVNTLLFAIRAANIPLLPRPAVVILLTAAILSLLKTA